MLRTKQENIRPQLPDKRILLLSWKFSGTLSNHFIEDLAASGIHNKRSEKKLKRQNSIRLLFKQSTCYPVLNIIIASVLHLTRSTRKVELFKYGDLISDG